MDASLEFSSGLDSAFVAKAKSATDEFEVALKNFQNSPTPGERQRLAGAAELLMKVVARVLIAIE